MNYRTGEASQNSHDECRVNKDPTGVQSSRFSHRSTSSLRPIDCAGSRGVGTHGSFSSTDSAKLSAVILATWDRVWVERCKGLVRDEDENGVFLSPGRVGKRLGLESKAHGIVAEFEVLECGARGLGHRFVLLFHAH